MNQEEAQYQKEFNEHLESAQQNVRDQMATRLMELKMKREEERRGLVSTLNEKRFRETTDDLRREDAKFYLKQCALEREDQMREKKAKMEAEFAEENLYAQLAFADIKKKEATERKIAEEKRKAEQDRLNVLKWQNDQNAKKRFAEE